MEKIAKIVFQLLELSEEGPSRKKDASTADRATACNNAVAQLCSSSARTHGDYAQWLSTCLQSFVRLCNDEEADVRLLAAQSLHQVTRWCLLEGGMNRVHVEMYKAMRGGGNVRSVKAALHCMAITAHLIRPSKTRSYAATLLPCMCDLMRRVDDMMYECTAVDVPTIVHVLGPHASHNECKALCKQCLVNVRLPSSAARRAAVAIADSLVTTCAHMRHYFAAYVWRHALDSLTSLPLPPLHELCGNMLLLRRIWFPLVEQCHDKRYVDWLDVEGSGVTDVPTTSPIIGHAVVVRHIPLNIADDHLVTLIDLLCDWVRESEDVPLVTASLELLCALTLHPSHALHAILIGERPSERGPMLASTVASSMAGSIADLSTLDLQLEDEEPMDGQGGPLFDSPSGDDNVDVSLARSASPSITPTDDRSETSNEDEEESIELAPCSAVEEESTSSYISYICLCAVRRLLLSSNGAPIAASKVMHKSLALALLHNAVSIDGSTVRSHMPALLQYGTHVDPHVRSGVAQLVGRFVAEGDEEMAPFIDILHELSSDASSSPVRSAVHAYASCAPRVMRSAIESRRLVDDIVGAAFHPYWLVKTSVVELVSTLDYSVGDVSIDAPRLLCVFVDELVCAEDGRVQDSAANAITSLVFSLSCAPPQTAGESPSECPIFGMPPVFEIGLRNGDSRPISIAALGRVATKLVTKLGSTSVEHVIVGCIKSLHALTQSCPPSVHPLEYCISRSSIERGKCVGMAQLSLHLLPVVGHDLNVHAQCLGIISSVLAGLSIAVLPSRPPEDMPWRLMGSGPAVTSLASHTLTHICQVLNVYWHVVHDSSPPPARPSAAVVGHNAQITHGHFVPSTYRLFEVVRGAYRNHRTALDAHKFTNLLESTLAALEVLLHASCHDDVSPYVRELLIYMLALLPHAMAHTLRVAVQLLGALFASNMHILHHSQMAYDTQFWCTKGGSKITRESSEYDTRAWLRRQAGWRFHRHDEEHSNLLRSATAKLAEYIHLFEPIVASALRLHTTAVTSTVQRNVLRLLSQLVIVRVNFNLLDQDMRFVNYLYRQLEQIEDGHYRGAPLVSEAIFTLLAQLTHERSNTTGLPIVDTPLLLRHADSLLASCLPFDTNVSPVLHGICIELFISRPSLVVDKPPDDELAMQQEVFAASLLKHVPWPTTCAMFTVILAHYRLHDEGERWASMSMELATRLCRVIKDGKIRLNSSSPSWPRVMHFVEMVRMLHSTAFTSSHKFIDTIDVDSDTAGWIGAQVVLWACIFDAVDLPVFLAQWTDCDVGDSLSRRLARGMLACTDVLSSASEAFGDEERRQKFVGLALRHMCHVLASAPQDGDVADMTRDILECVCGRLSNVPLVNLMQVSPSALVDMLSLAVPRGLGIELVDRCLSRLPPVDRDHLLILAVEHCALSSIKLSEHIRRLIALCDDIRVHRWIEGITSREGEGGAVVGAMCKLIDDESSQLGDRRRALHLLSLPSLSPHHLPIVCATVARVMQTTQHAIIARLCARQFKRMVHRAEECQVAIDTSEWSSRYVVPSRPSEGGPSSYVALSGTSYKWPRSKHMRLVRECVARGTPFFLASLANTILACDHEEFNEIVQGEEVSAALLDMCAQRLNRQIDRPAFLLTVYHAAMSRCRMASTMDNASVPLLACVCRCHENRTASFTALFSPSPADCQLMLTTAVRVCQATNGTPFYLRRKSIVYALRILLVVPAVPSLDLLHDVLDEVCSRFLIHQRYVNSWQLRAMFERNSANAIVVNGEQDEATTAKLVRLHRWVTSLVQWTDSDITQCEQDRWIALALCRLPICQPLARCAPISHATDWQPSCSRHVDGSITVSMMPVDLLVDPIVLHRLTFVVGNIGCTARHDFEEVWMALLGVLSGSLGDGQQAEVEERSRTSAMAVTCLTRMLATLVQGNNGQPLQRMTSSTSHRLPTDWQEHRSPFIIHAAHPPLSHCSTATFDSISPLPTPSDCAPDMLSCTRTLLDLYSHWMSLECTDARDDIVHVPSVLLLATLQSMLLICSSMSTQNWDYSLLGHVCRHLLRERTIDDELIANTAIRGFALAHAVNAFDLAPPPGFGQSSVAAVGAASVNAEMTELLQSSLSSAHVTLRHSAIDAGLSLLRCATVDEGVAAIVRDNVQRQLQHATTCHERPFPLAHERSLWSVAFLDTSSTAAIDLMETCVTNSTYPPSMCTSVVEDCLATLAHPSSTEYRQRVQSMIDALFVRPPTVAHVGYAAVLWMGREGKGTQVKAMEVFERMMHSYVIIIHVLCTISVSTFPAHLAVPMAVVALPKLVRDGLPAADLVNRCIHEMVTQHNPHLHANLLQCLFERMKTEASAEAILDWIILTLPSIAAMSSWRSLTFTNTFICHALGNEHINQLYPLAIDLCTRRPSSSIDASEASFVAQLSHLLVRLLAAQLGGQKELRTLHGLVNDAALSDAEPTAVTECWRTNGEQVKGLFEDCAAHPLAH